MIARRYGKWPWELEDAPDAESILRIKTFMALEGEARNEARSRLMRGRK